MTAPSIIEKPDTRDTNTDDDDHVSHFVNQRAWDIVQAMLDGTPVQGICGEWFVPNKDTKNRPVCQRCQELANAAHPTKRPSQQ